MLLKVHSLPLVKVLTHHLLVKAIQVLQAIKETFLEVRIQIRMKVEVMAMDTLIV